MNRIIAGQLASRRVLTASGLNTRPTTDRVREAVFSLLGGLIGAVGVDVGRQLEGLRFLDLYAGSGGVGLEAHSRGAEVTWVDRKADTVRANLSALGVAGSVFSMNVERFLRGKVISIQ